MSMCKHYISPAICPLVYIIYDDTKSIFVLLIRLLHDVYIFTERFFCKGKEYLTYIQ